MSNNYFHSITLDKEKCMGCTNCIKRCPTEAIRVRNGKAQIIEERCIDCGECIKVCPYHAKVAITNSLDEINKFKFKIALPAPTIYSQFKEKDINKIIHSLYSLGFDYVFEVAIAAEIVSLWTREIIKSNHIKMPIISSACPAVVRLIQIKFPNLIENILPLSSPMELAARISKEYISQTKNIKINDIGVFFISPCAAKMTYIKNPIGFNKSYVDGVIAIKDIYLKMRNLMKKSESIENKISDANPTGILWAASGGESLALGIDEYVNVDGIHNVLKVLEEIENGKMEDIKYFEGLACIGGCVGGPLTVENSFVAKNRIKALSSKYKKEKSSNIYYNNINYNNYLFEKKIFSNPVLELDSDIVEAMKKYEKANEIFKILPGLDCGACGSPTCKSLAEDIVRGQANDTDCIFILRESIKQLANKMLELSNKLPPSLESEEKE